MQSPIMNDKKIYFYYSGSHRYKFPLNGNQQKFCHHCFSQCRFITISDRNYNKHRLFRRFLAITPAQAKIHLHRLEQSAGPTGLCLNAKKKCSCVLNDKETSPLYVVSL